MNLKTFQNHLLLTIVFFYSAVFTHGAPQNSGDALPIITIAPKNVTGVYRTGEKIAWEIKAREDSKASVTKATFSIFKGGEIKLTQGEATFENGVATVEIPAEAPGTLLLEVTVPLPEKGPFKGNGGAVIDPEKIKPSMPVPDDFDAFWKSKLDELVAVPMNTVLEKADSGKPSVDYWKVTMDNIRGTHVYAQLARPEKGEKFPAMLILQWAGVYPLQKDWVTNYAAQGWLALNVMAHDLPIDEPKDYYDKLKDGDLKNYTSIGSDDRENSYFLRMFLGCYRAADYLSKRPDWNGEVFLVMGTSQGGLQSFFTAALFPKVTTMICCVPAGCDNTALQAGRRAGWPYWIASSKGKDEKKVFETSRYFDGVNFATRIKCTALVGLGLIDLTARPEGILAAYNQFQGTKENMILPLGPHKETRAVFGPFYDRKDAWIAALLKGQQIPPPGGK